MHPLDCVGCYNVVLGLLSPRRKEILEVNLGVSEFTVVKSDFAENIDKSDISDVEYVTATARGKIPSILSQLDANLPHLVIVADTVISCDGKVFEKPGNAAVQLEMFRAYQTAGTVQVITSVHVLVVREGHVVCHVDDVEITDLFFDTTLSDDILHAYAESGEGFNVAGGFQYQRSGCLLFKGLKGDYFNVVGLPAGKTFKLVNDAWSQDQAEPKRV